MWHCKTPMFSVIPKKKRISNEIRFISTTRYVGCLGAITIRIAFPQPLKYLKHHDVCIFLIKVSREIVHSSLINDLHSFAFVTS